MKSFARMIKILAVMFVVLFVFNMAVLYLFFDINVLNPIPKQTGSHGSVQNDRRVVLEKHGAGEGSGANERADPDGGNSENAEPEESTAPSSEEKSDKDLPDTDAYMTADEVACLSELSLSDKLTALSILTKLGTEETDTIYSMAADGVSMEEMVQIEAILRRHLTEEDIGAIVGILEQYKKSHAEQSALHD